jgi:hypothetical protein
MPAPAHRLIRDAVEAEEIAVDWLHWLGFAGARRRGAELALGIEGAGIVADVTFDPLPMERRALEAMVQQSGAAPGRFVSFTFAGWSPASFVWAQEHNVSLVRFTFAGTLDPSNDPARRLRSG